MHFAMPPRKTSRPPPYAARNSPGTSLVPPALKKLLRSRSRVVVGAVLGFLTLLWLLGIGGRSQSAPLANIPKVAIGSGPPVVIVTVLDAQADPAWVQKIKANRDEYAKKHGRPFLHVQPRCPLTPAQATSPTSPRRRSTPSTTRPRRGPASPPCATP